MDGDQFTIGIDLEEEKPKPKRKPRTKKPAELPAAPADAVTVEEKPKQKRMPAKKKPPAATIDIAAEEPAAPEYYSYDAIMDIEAVYRIIIGMRANGKTYGWADLAIDAFFDFGLPSAYIRRFDEMIKPKVIADLFDPHIEKIIEKSNGEYNGIVYRGNCWYMVKKAQNKHGQTVIIARAEEPFCRAYAINTIETTKGPDRGQVWSICFDEFITRMYYLANEFVLFQQLLSSIIRNRSGVQIFMLANTVSKSCPYFRDMGLFRVLSQEQGTIDVYQMGTTGGKIAVEYCAAVESVKKNVQQYFAFDNPQLDMITSGGWEIALYRHAPPEMAQYKIKLTFFILHEGNTLQGDLYIYKKYPIIFFHPKTGEIKKPEKTIIYNLEVSDGNPLHQCDMRVIYCRGQQIIYDLCRSQKTFYADNETGEAVAAYFKTQGLKAR